MKNNYKEKRINEEMKNTFGTKMKIIKYNNALDVIVEFQDEYKYKIKVTYQQFRNGEVTNPYDKTIFGIGYIGEGKYKSCVSKKKSLVYKRWYHMLERCYDPYYMNKYPTYIDCYVCKEWHCFQNFAEWWEENIYDCNNEEMHLDKDILIKGNKMYSPKTCIIVPQRINLLFTKRQNERGKYPIGVREHKGYLEVYCNIFENGRYRQKYLNSFSLDDFFQAFLCYKRFKENLIKDVANKYKEYIPKELYEALYKYEVEIND